MLDVMIKDRPMLSTEEQILHLKKKGVKFDLISEENAEKYLKENNNFFKLTAYRKSFKKYKGGLDDDTYIDLDFAMLKDLAIIDMRLRYVLMLYVLDIEHFAKVKLLKYISDSDDDGYNIVAKYIEKLQIEEDSDSQYFPLTKLNGEIRRNITNEYCGGIIAKYDDRYPVWAFVEIIPFGEFISFMRFCAEYFGDKGLKNDYFLLKDVKRLRNACAHNNCILNNLSLNTANQCTNYEVRKFLGSLGIKKNIADRRMSNAAMRDIITVLYTHNRIVKSEGVKEAQVDNLVNVIERCFKNEAYYATNELIKSSFLFFKKVVDKMYGL